MVRAAAGHTRRMVNAGRWLERSPISARVDAERTHSWQRPESGAAPPSLAVRLVVLDQRLTAENARAAAFPTPPLRPPAREVLAPALRDHAVRAPAQVRGPGLSR